MRIVAGCRRRARRVMWDLLHAKRDSHELLLTCGRARLRVASNSALARYLYEGSFESAMQTYLIHHLRPGMQVLDIGANIGVYTVQFAREVGASGHVYAFEPCPETAERLQANVTLNKLTNVTIVRKALADRDGTAQFHVFPDGADAYNSLGAAWRPKEGIRATQVIEVETTTLDAFARQEGLPSVDLIKLDVEGAEEAALRGGAGLLSASPKALVAVELYEPSAAQCGSSVDAIVQVLLSLGYQPHSVTGEGRRVRLAPVEDVAQVVRACSTRGVDLIFCGTETGSGCAAA